MAECKVEVCEATSCKYNKEKKCQLEKVMLDNKARCIYYSDKGAKAKTPYNVFPKPRFPKSEYMRDLDFSQRLKDTLRNR